MPMKRRPFPYRNPPRPGPHRAAWGKKPWYIVMPSGKRLRQHFRTKREATEAYRAEKQRIQNEIVREFKAYKQQAKVKVTA
jgi:hypothetical protein